MCTIYESPIRSSKENKKSLSFFCKHKLPERTTLVANLFVNLLLYIHPNYMH